MKEKRKLFAILILLLTIFLLKLSIRLPMAWASTQQPADASPVAYLPSINKPCTSLTTPQEIPYSFYHIRVELITTSDYATLRFLDSGYLLSIRQVEISPSPVYGFITTTPDNSQTYLFLTQPPERVGTEMHMTAEVALPSDAVNQNRTFQLEKFAGNQVTAKFYLLTESGAALLYEYTTTENWVTFPVDFSFLLGNSLSSGTIYHTCPTVWAIYYGWYMQAFYPRYWTSTIWTDKPIIPYSSDDPAAIARQIAEAKSAGIDGFLVEWCGIGNPDDNDILDANYATTLEVAKNMNFLIAPYYDILCTQGNISFFEYLIDQYGQHPAQYRINGKPVIAIFNTGVISHETWKTTIANLRTSGHDAFFVGEGYDHTQLEFFDGIHQYFNLQYPDLSYAYARLDQFTPYYSLLMEQPSPKIWAATVSPGFDNTPLVRMEGLPLLYIDRDNSNTYRNSLLTATTAHPNWIIITSWNEFQENTHIEPSIFYDSEYLTITRETLLPWKFRSP